jgi:hypothetical protein
MGTQINLLHFLAGMPRVLLLLTIVACAGAQCIPLRDLASITMRADYYTTSVPGVPQLTRTSAPTCKSALSRVTCENRGFNGTKIAWYCTGYGPHAGVGVRIENITCQPCDGGMVNGSCSVKYLISCIDDDDDLRTEWISLFFSIFIIIFLFFGVYAVIDPVCLQYTA